MSYFVVVVVTMSYFVVAVNMSYFVLVVNVLLMSVVNVLFCSCCCC